MSVVGTSGMRRMCMAAMGAAGVLGMTSYASDDFVVAQSYPWSHSKPWQAFDAASIRRGHQVYQEVCSSCHSLNLIAYRNLVDVCYTEEEAKALAADITVEDGVDEDGEPVERPGKLTDHFPAPFGSEIEARAANNGAMPPDLSLIIKARMGGADYLFALLTGYRDPPQGVQLREGMNYNPYFPGGAIGMPPQLNDGLVEYPDGTEATISQMAKDVTTFLCWTAEPEHDYRKKVGMKSVLLAGLTIIPALYWKRLKWSPWKTKVVQYFK